MKVDVIVAFGTKAVSAAMRATTTIPIVDPHPLLLPAYDVIQ